MYIIRKWSLPILISIATLWFVASIVLLTGFNPVSDNENSDIIQRIKKACDYLNDIQERDNALKIILQDFTKQIQKLNDGNSDWSEKKSIRFSDASDIQGKLEHAQKLLQQTQKRENKEFIPSVHFENKRRLVVRDVQETLFYAQAKLYELRKISGPSSSEGQRLGKIMEEIRDRIRVTQLDLEELSNLDGMEGWRKKEMSDLSDVLQNRLEKLQNPKDCSKARKLVCNLNKGCGYGCQIHHAVYCFIVAYGSKRTMILKSTNWRYNRRGWDDVFQPLSQTCTNPSGKSFSPWPGNEKTQVVELPIVDSMSPRPPYLPLAIPEDLSERIIRLSGNPAVWWVGQFLKYMLKLQPKTEKMLSEMKKALGFENPIVGVHIRRTDKVGTEAAFHSVEEYMAHVEEFYKVYSMSHPDVERRVFLASDDPNVISEAKKKFPDYTILGDPNISRTAALGTRYSDESLKGIIADIHFLSLCDYVVCTFSSQVCRIAYEIMQNLHPDASSKFVSLDDVYYFGGQSSHNQKARFDHVPQRTDEMALKAGDVVGIAGNHWNGESKGMNKRSRLSGLYPSYKVKEIVDVARFPSYAEFDANKEET